MSHEFDVFIAHAGEDKQPLATPIHQRLQEFGVKAFLDKEELSIGGHAPDDMTRAMQTAPIGLFILSPEFAAKEWPMAELKCFLDRWKQAEKDGDPRARPMLIPVFYRLTVAECRYGNVFKKYSSVLSSTNFLERLEAGVTSMKEAMGNLFSLAAHTGIENLDNITNDDSRAMRNGRMQLARKICLEVKSASIDVAYNLGSGSVFSDPVPQAKSRAAMDINSPADGSGMKHSIKFVISNNTSERMAKIGDHMDSGSIITAPDIVEPHRVAEGELKADQEAFGIKGVLLYQWECEQKAIGMFVENSAKGAMNGIQYFWDTWENDQWYYENMLRTSSSRMVRHTFDDWLTVKSFVTKDDHAGAAFVLETPW